MMFHATDFLVCVVIALTCSGIAMSFTQGSMFDPVRAWIMSKNKLLGDLFKCFFCLGHWLAFAGVAIYQPRPLQATLLADLVVAAFTIVTLSTLASGLMFATFFTAGQFHALRERMMQQQQGKAAVSASAPSPAGVHAPTS
jgi:hypothetical protein